MNKTVKHLTGSMIAVVVLALCLAVTTFALVYATLSAENNLFHTGTVQISLNGGQPVIREEEFLFEPGATLTKTFTLANEGTADVYYKLYFDHVDGGLAGELTVTLMMGDQILYCGSAKGLTREGVNAAPDVLRAQQTRTFTISFTLPDYAGNEAQDQSLSFGLCADAVQTKNNPNRIFD